VITFPELDPGDWAISTGAILAECSIQAVMGDQRTQGRRWSVKALPAARSHGRIEDLCQAKIEKFSHPPPRHVQFFTSSNRLKITHDSRVLACRDKRDSRFA
jgi:hypothetical protein